MTLRISITSDQWWKCQYFPCNWKYGLFRNIVVYIDKYRDIGRKESEIQDYNCLNLAKLNVEFYGGRNIDELNCESKVTHVITSTIDLSRLDKIKEIRRLLPQGKKFRIVCDNWVHDCLDREQLVCESKYELWYKAIIKSIEIYNKFRS